MHYSAGQANTCVYSHTWKGSENSSDGEGINSMVVLRSTSSSLPKSTYSTKTCGTVGEGEEEK